MRKYVMTLVSVCFGITMVAQGRNMRPVYHKADSVTICRLLSEVRRQPADMSIPLFFARQFLGVPYVAHTLESEGDERLVVNTRQLDCTTLIETVTALTRCVYSQQYTWQAYLKALTAMRYRQGIIDRYTSRIHYFTEWITENSNRGLVTEIQQPNPPFTAVQTVNVNYMSQHPGSYQALRRHPEYVSEIRRMEQSVSGQKFRFIPKARVGRSAELRKVVRDGDIIAITCKKAGLDIAHLGLAVWKNGNLHLLNASQLHKQVVEEPMTLWQYLQKHPSHTGIRIIRINK
ncbi:MAG: DUF1460 domain-containing protein [Prevotella sp.]|nr:DUF1460 domain-containing protein [Prevotella sp.]